MDLQITLRLYLRRSTHFVRTTREIIYKYVPNLSHKWLCDETLEHTYKLLFMRLKVTLTKHILYAI